MTPQNFNAIKSYFHTHKTERLTTKWQWLLSHGILGTLLYKRIVSPTRISRFISFYLSLKKVDWSLLPNTIEGNILDVACNIPLDAFWLSKLATVNSMTIVDMEKPCGLPIEKVSFVKSNAITLPFDDNTFDLVISYSSIEHLTNREGQQQWIKEMTRVVKRGGIVSVTVDNSTSILNGFQFFEWFKNKNSLPLSWKQLKQWILESGTIEIEKKASTGIYMYTSWFRPWAESFLSYLLMKILKPFNGKFSAIDARIGFRYKKIR